MDSTMALEEDDDAFDVSSDLLERARRLCAAANEISLPVLVPPKKNRKEAVLPASNKPARDAAVSEKKRTESAGSTRSDVDASSKKTLVRMLKKEPVSSQLLRDEREQQQEALPRLDTSADQWRKQREAEKIRQAQERAKARLLKSNQHELPALKRIADAPLPAPAEEAKATPAVGDASERERQHALCEESRRRAEERVKERNRQRRHKLEEGHGDESTMPAVRRQTKSTRKYASVDAVPNGKRTCDTEDASTTPASDEEEQKKQQKKLEKKRRHETAKRLQRMQQVAADHERKEQERVESELQAFRNMRKEMERVGQCRKSRSRDCERESTPLPLVEESGSKEKLECSPELNDFVHLSLDNGNEPLDHQSPNQQDVSLSLTIERERNHELPDAVSHATSHAPSSSGTKARRRRLPAWKQPPVPVLPAEFYVPKAVASPGQSAQVSMSSESYASRYHARSGNSSSPTPGSGTFL